MVCVWGVGGGGSVRGCAGGGARALWQTQGGGGEGWRAGEGRGRGAAVGVHGKESSAAWREASSAAPRPPHLLHCCGRHGRKLPEHVHSAIGGLPSLLGAAWEGGRVSGRWSVWWSGWAGGRRVSAMAAARGGSRRVHPPDPPTPPHRAKPWSTQPPPRCSLGASEPQENMVWSVWRFASLARAARWAATPNVVVLLSDPNCLLSGACSRARGSICRTCGARRRGQGSGRGVREACARAGGRAQARAGAGAPLQLQPPPPPLAASGRSHASPSSPLAPHLCHDAIHSLLPVCARRIPQSHRTVLPAAAAGAAAARKCVCRVFGGAGSALGRSLGGRPPTHRANPLTNTRFKHKKSVAWTTLSNQPPSPTNHPRSPHAVDVVPQVREPQFIQLWQHLTALLGEGSHKAAAGQAGGVAHLRGVSRGDRGVNGWAAWGVGGAGERAGRSAECAGRGARRSPARMRP